jgi:hypothetical protein
VYAASIDSVLLRVDHERAQHVIAAEEDDDEEGEEAHGKMMKKKP